MDKQSIDKLFEQLSFEEIESIKDNLGDEIDKKTNQLKTIVKEKYCDIVEASDAIQSMKLNLTKTEESIWKLDEAISSFYKQFQTKQSDQQDSECDEKPKDRLGNGLSCGLAGILMYDNFHEIWDKFDEGDIKGSSMKLLECENIVKRNGHRIFDIDDDEDLLEYQITLYKAKQMIKNHISCSIQEAKPDQISIFGSSALSDREFFQLCLESAIQLLSSELAEQLSDTSPKSRIRRYQEQSYFNRQTNIIDDNMDLSVISSQFNSTHITIPKLISPELSNFLYQACKSVNTIAGYHLDRDSIGISLEMTLREACKAYENVHSNDDKNREKTTSSTTTTTTSAASSSLSLNRYLQFYYDILYLKSLLGHSKNINIIEKMAPEISRLASKFEKLLDPVELIMISESLHDNVVKLRKSTARLYALLTNNSK